MLVSVIAVSCTSSSTHHEVSGGIAPGAQASPPEQPFVKRPFSPVMGTRWIGNGISYGPHRDGQTPSGPGPTPEQLREDLHIVQKHWNFIRMYAVGPETEVVLRLIRDEHLPLKVMLGAWIATEMKVADGGIAVEEYPQAREANRRQVEMLVRLANEYPDIVLAVTVGNETQVFWSAHKVPTESMIRFIREVRSRTKVPVATADDFNYWNKPESRILARELDFIVTHIYAMWGGQPLERALPFTEEKYAEVSKMHPGYVIVLGEAGWATQKHSEGEQAKLIKGEVGEEQQKTFYEQFVAWTTREKIANCFFEAFDENWKGGAHPDEVEKHWGLYHSDRTPKKVLQGAN
jgi:exo-beta-1,3-glucanase (GH17 family)